MKRILVMLISFVFLTVLPVSARDFPVSETVQYHDTNTGLTIVSGDVSLPGNGYWQTDKSQDLPDGWHDIFLRKPKPVSRNKPAGQSSTRQNPDSSVQANYKIYAAVSDTSKNFTKLPVVNLMTGDKIKISWSLKRPNPGSADILKQWAQFRVYSWMRYDQGNGADIMDYWIDRSPALYGTDPVSMKRMNRSSRARNSQNIPHLFNILGGRAAIRETLQLQAISTNSISSWNASIPVSTLTGVKVKSLPFEDMLKGQKGGTLPIADLVPRDRFFAYFADPKGLLELMDGGSRFLFQGGSSFTGRSIEYRLTKRYLNDLGLSETWTRQMINCGAVKEMAIVLPDLFLVDGTDVTVIARLQSPKISYMMLKIFGMEDLSNIVEKKTVDGKTAFWTQQDQLLFISTRKDELNRVLELSRHPENSLGQNAEFKYMLLKQPVLENTVSYYYFSDAFIRHLVGPEVKIAQLRRLTARSEIEAISAGALLYQADGNPFTNDISLLMKKKYIPRPQLAKKVMMDNNGQCRSSNYGTPSHMATLPENPVNLISPLESEAYSNYVTKYNRFWRRFFDPIGLRVDRINKKEMEISTYILPLIQNSIYQGANEVLMPAENRFPLPIPELSPRPVSTLSLNLSPKIMNEMIRDFKRTFGNTLGMNPAILDHLRPDIHLALADADPIISFGSGELSGLAGAFGGFNEGSMVFIPAVVSMLTRPCVILIGVDDPNAVADELNRAAIGQLSGRSFFGVGSGYLYSAADKNAWYYEISAEKILSMRFGIQIKDRYLMISNLPYSYDPDVIQSHSATYNGASLSLCPAACIKQMPALYASATARQRLAAMHGMGCLYPFILTNETDIEKIRNRHFNMFGFTPVHPGNGKFLIKDGQIVSSDFGTPLKPVQPAFNSKNRQFGILQDIESVHVNMQFEGDSLRASCRWILIDN